MSAHRRRKPQTKSAEAAIVAERPRDASTTADLRGPKKTVVLDGRPYPPSERALMRHVLTRVEYRNYARADLWRRCGL